MIMLIKLIPVLQQLYSTCVLMLKHLSIFVFTSFTCVQREAEKDIYLRIISVTAWHSLPCPPSPFSLPLLSLILWKQHLLLSPCPAAALGCNTRLCVSLADLQSKHTERSSLQTPLGKFRRVCSSVFTGEVKWIWEIKESAKWGQHDLPMFYHYLC